MFTIRIKTLQVPVLLGVYEQEKQAKRPVTLNIEIHMDDPISGDTDEVRDTVDYAMIESHILTHLDTAAYNLIERLVTDLGRMILSLDKRIARVTVEADKPDALRQAVSVSVERSFERPAS